MERLVYVIATMIFSIISVNQAFAKIEPFADCPATDRLNPSKFFVKTGFFGGTQIINECLEIDDSKQCPTIAVKLIGDLELDGSFATAVSGDVKSGDLEYFATRLEGRTKGEKIDLYLLAFRTGQTGWKKVSRFHYVHCKLRY